ncbi:MAG: Mur ligase family protein [Candidatus Gracilibacteria bacterium]|jgi:dihydrofolate synthase/folylpolyglutamate synthase
MDFESAVTFLKSFNPYEDEGFPKYNEKNFNVERLRIFLDAYDVGFGKLKYVHVTGSKGKSSVCGMIGNYLHRSGYKVGVFTTPYVLDLTECIWLNGKNISKKVFVEYVSDLKKIVDEYKGPMLTYFELLTAVMLRIFVLEKVDFAVIEVGLGGRLDATNVINAKVAVLTLVEKEHVELLGKTYDGILNEKLGIVVGKNVKNLVVGKQIPCVERLVRAKVRKVKNVVFVKRVGNDAIAFDVLKSLLGDVDVELFRHVVENFKMIGRFDVRMIEDKIVVFDMAHTKNSIDVLLRNLGLRFPKKSFKFLVSIMKNKNVKDVLLPICRVGKEVVVTSSNSERGYSSAELKALALKLGLKVQAVENFESAYENMLKKMGAGNVLVVTGSHFLVGKVLSLFCR